MGTMTGPGPARGQGWGPCVEEEHLASSLRVLCRVWAEELECPVPGSVPDGWTVEEREALRAWVVGGSEMMAGLAMALAREHAYLFEQAVRETAPMGERAMADADRLGVTPASRALAAEVVGAMLETMGRPTDGAVARRFLELLPDGTGDDGGAAWARARRIRAVRPAWPDG